MQHVDSSKVLDKILRHYESLVEVNMDSFKSLNYSAPEIQKLCFEIAIEVIKDLEEEYSILDVGCGLSHLYDYIKEKGLSIRYHGLDISKKMIEISKEKNNEIPYYNSSIFDLPADLKFDFIFAVGVFTRKTVFVKSDEFKKIVFSTIGEMYRRCNCAIAFNCITSYVEFKKKELFYMKPEQVFRFCRSLSRHVCIRHDYPLWDFTVYVYNPEYVKKIYKFYR